jgi:hypothetical protein
MMRVILVVAKMAGSVEEMGFSRLSRDGWKSGHETETTKYQFAVLPDENKK